tara:strand:- start:2132 stop:3349 length:1218 start_codon:yes stop_codon:yes gene_type:complete
MKLSSRVRELNESVTLKLNAKATTLAEEGREIYNLTAGQLPFRPMPEFTNLLRSELDFLKSYQYAPVPGFADLRKKIISYLEQTRDIKIPADFDCVIGNGAKHAIANVLGCLLELGDEVVLLAPYWVSYPEMVKFCRGKPVIVNSSSFDQFEPNVEDIEAAITKNTRVVIINSPNNPAGIHYSEKWMREFAAMIKKYPDVAIISDEIYYELSYFDPKPTFFYQYEPELLSRTVIVDGISKTLASTGLRIGWCVCPKDLAAAVSKLQGQTTSGANSLVQRALAGFDLSLVETFLDPIKRHLRDNSETLRESLRTQKLSHSWYQSTSAFYFLIDFSQCPAIKTFKKSDSDTNDYSFELCEALLEKHGVAMVPGQAFGMPNTARLSLVMEKEPFKIACDKITNFMNGD